jgi:hypothetical protein
MRIKNPVARALIAVFWRVSPVAVLVLWGHWCRVHVIIVAVLYITYLMIVQIIKAVHGFAAKVMAIVNDRLADRLADVIIEKLWDRWSGGPRRDSKFEHAYRSYIEEVCRMADQSGLPSIAPKALKLDDVFVDVSLRYRSPQQMPHGVVEIEPQQGGVRKPIWDFLDAGPHPIRLALIGVPGSGKSTLLRHVALHPEGPGGKRRQRTLPVLLRLRECSASIIGDPAPHLPEMINDRLGRLPVPPPHDWFARQLTEGRCVIMFDGLDEIAGEQDRQTIVTWITEQMELYPGNDYLVTSRPRGYRENPLLRADQLQLREFTPEQVRRFIRDWYRATEIVTSGHKSEHNSGNPTTPPVTDEAEDLIRRLEDNSPLSDFAVNPLLLTMIAIVHRYNNGVLPDTRAELYAEMCEVLLERPEHAKPLPELLLPGQKEAVLADLAFTMMSRTTFDLPAAEAAQVASSSLAALSSSLDASRFLENVRDSGLLVESERGAYSFAHPTFQEYLAAVGVRDPARRQILLDSVRSTWWRETIVLYSARNGAGAIVEACLASGELGALTLAVECADADEHLDPRLREQLNKLLLDASNPSVPTKRRRLALAVAATRELRSTVKLADGTRVCATPVTRRVYDLFTYQKHAEYPEQPDVGGPGLGPGEPIVGVAATEAAEIVEWLNDLLRDEEIVYRFPTWSEARDPRFSGSPLVKPHSVWLTPEGDGRDLDLWCAPPTRHPYLISASQLWAGADADADHILKKPLAVVLVSALAHTLATIDALARAHLGPGKNRPDLTVKLRGQLEQVRRLGLNLAATFEPDPAGAMNAALVSVLDGALTRPGRPDYAPGLVAMLINEGNIPRARAPGLALDLARIRAADLADVLGTVVADAVVPRLTRPVIRTADLAVRVSPILNRALDCDFNLAYNLNFVQPAVAGIDVALCALFESETSQARRSRKVNDLLLGLALRDVIQGPTEWTIVPSLLRRLARDGATRIKAMAPGLKDDHLRKRAAAIAERINDAVSDLDENDSQIAPEVVSFIRFGALAISVGARKVGWDAGLISAYVDIAAGITALERRADGRAPRNEVVVLVRG